MRLRMVWMSACMLGCVAVGLALSACDDGGGDAADVAVLDAQAVEPDAAASGCSRDIDCLATEYCDREAPAEDSDAEPPLGTCEPGCRLEPDTCPRGRACSPETRLCYAECICEAGAVNGCEGQALRICNDDCLSHRAEACPQGQLCMGGQCRMQEMPPPMPDMAPPPPPDMAPPEPDMAPPAPDMAVDAPDMAVDAPDVAPAR